MFSQKLVLQSNFVVQLKKESLPCLRIWNILMRFSAMTPHVVSGVDTLFCDYSSCLKYKKRGLSPLTKSDWFLRQRNHLTFFFYPCSSQDHFSMPASASSYTWLLLPIFLKFTASFQLKSLLLVTEEKLKIKFFQCSNCFVQCHWKV